MAQFDINPNFIPNQNQRPQQSPGSQIQIKPKFKGPVSSKSIAALAILMVVLVVVIAFLLFAYNKVQNARVVNFDDKIASIDKDLLKMKAVEQTSVALKTQIDNINKITGSRNYVSDTLSDLSARLTKDVQLDNLSITSDSQAKATGKARSINSVAKMMTSLSASENISDVKVSSVSYNESKESGGYYSFNLDFKINISSSPAAKATTNQ